MRLAIVHTESIYFAGAQRMLGYYLEELRNHCEITVVMTDNHRVLPLIPIGVRVIRLSGCANSVVGLPRQLHTVASQVKSLEIELFHGWTARDWELAASLRWALGVPAVGTLHDHPQAGFISHARQALMHGAAVLGLDGVVCVSKAVQEACLRCGYDPDRTEVIRNGLPLGRFVPSNRNPGSIRFGFIGAFSDRKGIVGLFAMMHHLSLVSKEPWELWVAGGAQEASGKALWSQLVESYRDESWWGRVKLLGWLENTDKFFEAIDLLICPSKDFDPFPTVLLEAAKAGVPALATRVGGVEEIVVDFETGWIVNPADWKAGGDLLASILSSPNVLESFGINARYRMERAFTIKKMVADYMALYSGLLE